MDKKTLKWLSVPLLAGSLLSGYYLWNRESQFDNPTRIVEVPPIALIEERKDNSNSNTNNNPISPIINNKSGESGDDNVNSSKSQNENASAQPNPTNTSQPKKSLEEILSFNRYLNYNYLENLDYEARLKALDEAKQNNDALALFGEYVNLRLFNLALQIAPQLGVGNDIVEEFRGLHRNDTLIARLPHLLVEKETMRRLYEIVIEDYLAGDSNNQLFVDGSFTFGASCSMLKETNPDLLMKLLNYNVQSIRTRMASNGRSAGSLYYFGVALSDPEMEELHSTGISLRREALENLLLTPEGVGRISYLPPLGGGIQSDEDDYIRKYLSPDEIDFLIKSGEQLIIRATSDEHKVELAKMLLEFNRNDKDKSIIYNAVLYNAQVLANRNNGNPKEELNALTNLEHLLGEHPGVGTYTNFTINNISERRNQLMRTIFNDRRNLFQEGFSEYARHNGFPQEMIDSVIIEDISALDTSSRDFEKQKDKLYEGAQNNPNLLSQIGVKHYEFFMNNVQKRLENIRYLEEHREQIEREYKEHRERLENRYKRYMAEIEKYKDPELEQEYDSFDDYYSANRDGIYSTQENIEMEQEDIPYTLFRAYVVAFQLGDNEKMNYCRTNVGTYNPEFGRLAGMGAEGIARYYGLQDPEGVPEFRIRNIPRYNEEKYQQIMSFRRKE